MLRISVLAVAAAAGAEAFAPGSAPLLRTFGRPRTSAASTCATNIVMQRSGRPIDRKDGFGGGFDAIKKKLDERRSCTEVHDLSILLHYCLEADAHGVDVQTHHYACINCMLSSVRNRTRRSSSLLTGCLASNSTDDWGGNGTGGASGKLGGGDTTDFAAYMAKRAAEAGGKVLSLFEGHRVEK